MNKILTSTMVSIVLLSLMTTLLVGCNDISGIEDFTFDDTSTALDTAESTNESTDKSASRDTATVNNIVDGDTLQPGIDTTTTENEYDTTDVLDTTDDVDTSDDTDTALHTTDTATSSPANKELGTFCTKDEECVSTYCANNVCCNAACTEQCQSCSSDGICNITPTDDTTCSKITCKSDSPCASYSFPAQACKEFGVCNTQDDCIPKYASAQSRTQCGLTENDVCDGKGNCEFRAAVNCGNAGICERGNRCCVNTNGDGICATGAFDCPVSASSKEQIKLSCDSNDDCKNDTICTLLAVPYETQRSVSCSSPADVAEDNYKTPICRSTGDCQTPALCEAVTGGYAQYLKGYCVID